MSRGKKSLSSGDQSEIDLKPFINFLIVLVPVLMLSAEFAKISVIKLKLPPGRGTQTSEKVTQTQSLDDESDKLLLTMIVTDSVVTLGAKGGFLPSLFYKEYHRYVAKDNKTKIVDYEYDASKPEFRPQSPVTGKPFDISERQEIMLYLTDENRTVMQSLYTKEGEMLTDAVGKPILQASVGDTVYIVRNPRTMVIVSNPGAYKLTPISAYDDMKNRLMRVKERYRDARDAEDIIIAAENQVAYDKIVQLMDVAKMAEFPNISIAKLRA